MRKLILMSILVLSLFSFGYTTEVTWTIDTWVSTSWLWFELPCSPASVSNWTVDSSTCVITCDTGYDKSWESCVRQSSWGWGWWGWGWWSSICLNSQLECKESLWVYKWYRKPWITCVNWNLGKACTLDDVETETEWDIEEIEKKTEELWFSSAMQKVVDKFDDIILPIIEDMKFLAEWENVEDLQSAYLDFLDKLKQYENWEINESELKIYINDFLNKKNEISKLLKEIEEEYVIRSIKYTFYVPKFENSKVNRLVSIITQKIVEVFKKKSLSSDKLQKVLDDYSNFLLWIKIMKEQNKDLWKKMAKEYLAKILPYL